MVGGWRCVVVVVFVFLGGFFYFCGSILCVWSGVMMMFVCVEWCDVLFVGGVV